MTSGKYKISLITPVYNAVDYLGNTFRSVKAQTIGFDSIEWILVDDCSTDDSFNIISGWAKEYDNVKVFQTSANTGTPAEPRNIGLENASAPYVMFLDNDDELYSDAMEALYNEIEQSSADIVSGDVALMNSGQFSPEERIKLLNYNIDIEPGFHEMTHPAGKWIEPFLNNHWSKIYRLDIIREHNIQALRGELWEDILFMYEYLTYVKTVSYIKKPVINFRVRRESLSHNLNIKYLTSLPKSVNYGFDCMLSAGESNVRDYVEFLTSGGWVEANLDFLLNCEYLSEDELKQCLLAWKRPFVYTSQFGGRFHSAYARILSDDFTNDDEEKAVFHFFTLKELYKQRQAEINNILNSNTYKLAKRFSDIKDKLTAKK